MARQTPQPRPTGSRRAVDAALFAADVQAALSAFAQDASYAVDMANAAAAITRKREVAQARKDAKAAEAAAHAECRAAAPFTCAATNPCGTGDCKYAHGEMALLDVATCPGDTARPQDSRTGRYNIEAAVAPLVILRASHQ